MSIIVTYFLQNKFLDYFLCIFHFFIIESVLSTYFKKLSVAKYKRLHYYSSKQGLNAFRTHLVILEFDLKRVKKTAKWKVWDQAEAELGQAQLKLELFKS